MPMIDPSHETEPLLRRFLASHPEFQVEDAWRRDAEHPASVWRSRAGCHVYAAWVLAFALGTAAEQAMAACLLDYLDQEGESRA
jgi:hypothetical protein